MLNNSEIRLSIAAEICFWNF